MREDSTPPTQPAPELLRHLVPGAIELIQEGFKRATSDSVWQSGDPDLLTTSRQVHELRLVLGASGAGKTALAACLLSNLLENTKDPQPAAWFNFRETAAHSALRLLCLSSRVPLSRIAAGEVRCKKDIVRIQQNAFSIRDHPVYIEDSRSLSAGELAARCERWSGQPHRLRLILIDPLEALLDTGGNAWGSSPQAREEIAETLRLVANELGALVVCFASVPDKVEEAGCLLSLANLPDSLISIVEEADLVAVLEKRDALSIGGVVPASLNFLKQNHTNHPDVIPLIFRSSLLRFESAE